MNVLFKFLFVNGMGYKTTHLRKDSANKLFTLYSTIGIVIFITI